CAAMAAQKHSIKTIPPQDWGGMGGVDDLMANRNQSEQDKKGTGIFKLRNIGSGTPCPERESLWLVFYFNFATVECISAYLTTPGTTPPVNLPVIYSPTPA
ncbi:MAG: hypothetical protein ACYC36_05770, partial [Bellilinea sp.]